MITLLLTLAGVLILAGFCVFVIAVAQAPEGYEDELGFHYVRPKRAVKRAATSRRPAMHPSVAHSASYYR
ncbi:MAG: hypothetical protein JNG83_03665 [Opitutaceae bacterium]|nr:hypothetical protein [Opitutaceae bacterium]